VLKLGLTYGSDPEEPCLETEILAVPEEPASSFDEAIRELELLKPETPDLTFIDEAEVPAGVPGDLADAIAYWVTGYNANPSLAARNIRELSAKEPDLVAQVLIDLYQQGRWGEAAPFLGRLLSTGTRTAAELCDPAASLQDSIRMAKVLMQNEPRFDARFAKGLLGDEQMTEAARHRGFEILQNLSSSVKLTPILIQFLRDPDRRIRSKAAMMFGQIMPAQRIREQLMADEDARVRANFVEGLWNSTSDCQALFRQALDDPYHRVVGNALIGLHRLGEERDVIMHVGRMARRPDVLFRAAAAWVMGQTGGVRYVSVLRHMVRDAEQPVRSNALRALRRINLAGATDKAAKDLSADPDAAGPLGPDAS
jgi:hypothetical protein